MFGVQRQMYYKGKVYSSVGNRILVEEKEDNPKRRTYLKIKELSSLNYFRLYNRLLRHGIHSFYKIDESFDCVIIKNQIQFYKNGELANSLKLEKGSRPLRHGVVYLSHAHFDGHQTVIV